MKLNVVILGCGKLGSQLAGRVSQSKYTLTQVYNRTLSKCRRVGKKCNVDYTSALSKINPNADVYIISISDDAIKGFAKSLLNIIPEKATVLHTSGAGKKELVSKYFENGGVFWPMQSFSHKKNVDWSRVPILFEGSNKNTIKLISSLAKTIGGESRALSFEQRQWMHLVAVFANNFPNFIFGVAHELCVQNKLPWPFFESILAETSKLAIDGTSAQFQSGPAARDDKATIKRQLKLLASNSPEKKMYQLMSKLISESEK